MPGSGRIGRKGIVVMENDRWFNFATGAERVAHLFINQAVPKAPPWLHVGLAQYLAGYRVHYSGNRWIACFGSRSFPISVRPKGYLTDQDARRILLPVAEIIGADWFDYDERLRNWFRFTSFALVHYLIHGRNGAHRPRFQVLLRAMGKGTSTEEALALAYPHLLPDEWDTELETHIRPTRAETAVANFGASGSTLRASQLGGRTDIGEVAVTPTVVQGHCLRVPPLDYTADKPKRTPVDEREIREVMTALRRLPVNKRFSLWYPEEVVRILAEPERGGTGQGAGGGRGGEGKGGGGAGTGASRGGASGPGGVPEKGAPRRDDDGLLLREAAPPAPAPATPSPERDVPPVPPGEAPEEAPAIED